VRTSPAAINKEGGFGYQQRGTSSSSAATAEREQNVEGGRESLGQKKPRLWTNSSDPGTGDAEIEPSISGRMCVVETAFSL
jgi:hypothetical protein